MLNVLVVSSRIGKGVIKNALLGIFALALIACEPESKEIPVSDGVVQANGSDIYYKVMGEGDPLVIVHGGPVLDHTYFLPHLESLAQDYQLIFYDQRAAGRSSTQIDSSKMTLLDFAGDIEFLRKELGHEKINLLGHSWGGLIAMIYGIQHSDKLDHLILANSMASNVIDWQAEAAEVGRIMTEEDKAQRQRFIDSLRSNPPNRNEVVAAFLKTSFLPQMYDRSNLEKLEINIPSDYNLRSRLTQLLGKDLANFHFDKALNRISCPTLLLYGDTEVAVELYVDKMAKLIPNSEKMIIPGSGHFPFIEQPFLFKKSVKEFLDQ